MQKIIAQSPKETKKIAARLARKILATKKNTALVFALEGDLGSGKTTFVQGFAEALGVKENVLSPTFVLMKVYSLSLRAKRNNLLGLPQRFAPRNDRVSWFRHLIHIDCYRLDSPKDLLHLGFHDILKDKDVVILIEWAERVQNLLPRDVIRLQFEHGHQPRIRIIKIFNFQ